MAVVGLLWPLVASAIKLSALNMYN